MLPEQSRRRSDLFLGHLAAATLSSPLALGHFGRIVARDGAVDLKQGALTPLVSLARLCSLEAASRARNTASRLEAAAEAVGLKMPRATVIVFGNPRVGTPVFVKTPTVAIDLPLKAMVWADQAGNVFLSYNAAEYLFGVIYPRHGIQGDKAAAANVEAALTAMADEAVK